MLKFNKVLLASDFDNTLVYTQSALDNGTDIPPMFFDLHRPRAARLCPLRQGSALQRPLRHRQRSGHL